MKAALSKTSYLNFNMKSKSKKKNTISRGTPPKPVKINDKVVSFHTLSFRKDYSGQLDQKHNLEFWGCAKQPRIRFPHNSYFYPEEKPKKKLTGESQNLLNYYVMRKQKFYKKNMIVSLSSDKSQDRMSKSFNSLQSKQYVSQLHSKNPERSIQYQTKNTELSSSKYFNEDSNRKTSILNDNLQYLMKLQELDEKIFMRKKMLKQFNQGIQKIKYRRSNFFQ